MKKTINAGIGGRSFILDEDAYQRLDSYLIRFKDKANMGYQTKEVMDDLESRIAELFSQAISSPSHVVDLKLVEQVISQLGMPDGSADDSDSGNTGNTSNYAPGTAPKRFYRDNDNRVIGGVCSGLALYLNIDIVLVRILFVLIFLFGTVGFWAYIVLWIVAPKAETAAQKCEMRGWPVTAENMAKFSKK